ncbi:MAG: hypothetical protein JWN56_753 [Sphingobacteriales bacterium]|nr:hypothetical protein [Sphingobacteriales bacterium]
MRRVRLKINKRDQFRKNMDCTGSGFKEHAIGVNYSMRSDTGSMERLSHCTHSPGFLYYGQPNWQKYSVLPRLFHNKIFGLRHSLSIAAPPSAFVCFFHRYRFLTKKKHAREKVKMGLVGCLRLLYN